MENEIVFYGVTDAKTHTVTFHKAQVIEIGSNEFSGKLLVKVLPQEGHATTVEEDKWVDKDSVYGGSNCPENSSIAIGNMSDDDDL